MQNRIPAPVPQQIPHPNLNLPPPPSYSGSPLLLPTFKMKLIHFLVGDRNTYPDSESQLLYAGQLLEGPAYQWYQSIVDPHSFQLPPSNDLGRFFQELEDFFGGAVTLHSRERSLDLLRQTGSVSDLAIAFQNITHLLPPMARSPPHLPFFPQVKGKHTFRTYRSWLPPLYLACLPCGSHLRRAKPGCRSPLPLPTLLSATPSQPPPPCPPSA